MTEEAAVLRTTSNIKNLAIKSEVLTIIGIEGRGKRHPSFPFHAQASSPKRANCITQTVLHGICMVFPIFPIFDVTSALFKVQSLLLTHCNTYRKRSVVLEQDLLSRYLNPN